MFVGFILLLVSLTELGLASFFFFGYRRNQATLWYGLFSIAVALYVGGNALGYLGWLAGRWSEHLAWLGGVSTAVFFLPFSFSFPIPFKKICDLLPLILWPLSIFIPGILLTNAFIQQQSIVEFGKGYATAQGPYIWFMLLFFAVYWIWSIVNIIRSQRRSDGLHKRYLNIILLGIISSLVISGIFDIYIPLFSPTRFGYVGSLFTSIWLATTSYIILK